MTSKDDQARRDWLFIDAIVGDSGIELRELDDGDPELAPHEPSDAELVELAAAVTSEQLAAQQAAVDALIRERWQRRRVAPPQRTISRRTLEPGMSRLELLAMVDQLHGAHPGQFAQHYRNLDDMTDEMLRALVEDMLTLVDDDNA
jgi:hypothetical protein